MLMGSQDFQGEANRDFRDLASEEFDTRTLLRNAVDQAIARKYEDFLIVDTDSHHSIFRVRRVLKPGGAYVTLGGETGDIFGGLLGPLISLFSDKWTGLMLWWKPMNRPRSR